MADYIDEYKSSDMLFSSHGSCIETSRLRDFKNSIPKDAFITAARYSDARIYKYPHIDVQPFVCWDDEGKVYVTAAFINIKKLEAKFDRGEFDGCVL